MSHNTLSFSHGANSILQNSKYYVIILPERNSFFSYFTPVIAEKNYSILLQKEH